jgi:hypothetical protein
VCVCVSPGALVLPGAIPSSLLRMVYCVQTLDAYNAIVEIYHGVGNVTGTLYYFNEIFKVPASSSGLPGTHTQTALNPSRKYPYTCYPRLFLFSTHALVHGPACRSRGGGGERQAAGPCPWTSGAVLPLLR